MIPYHWSLMKKLIWLKKAISSGAIWKTVTGSLIHITDALASPVNALSVSIDPVQSGSGDPSPDNVRPISGWTGAKVNRTGKNLVKLSAENEYAGLSQYATPVYTDSGASFSADHTYARTAFLYHVKAGNTYRLSFQGVRTGGYGRVLLHNKADSGANDQNYGYIQLTETEARYAKTIDATTDVLRIVFYVTASQSSASMTVSDFQLELGSTTTAYEPYAGTTIPITFPTLPGTVYGGTLDVVSGVLTVERVKHVFTGTESVALTQTGTHGYRFGFLLSDGRAPTTAQRTDFVCNIMTPDGDVTSQERYRPGMALLYKSNSKCYMMCVVPLEYNTQTKAKQYLLDNGLEVVYPLAEPQTYQLTPQEVSTLLGENNIWADTGDTTLTYMARG